MIGEGPVVKMARKRWGAQNVIRGGRNTAGLGDEVPQGEREY